MGWSSALQISLLNSMRLRSVDSTLSKVEAEVAKAKAYRFIHKQVEALQIIIKQEKLPFADPVVMRSLQSQFWWTEAADRYLRLPTEIARKIQLLVDSVHVASFEVVSIMAAVSMSSKLAVLRLNSYLSLCCNPYLVC